MSYIKFANIDKKYPGADFATVEGLNLEVNQGDFVVLVGPSGCGKSTTLRMLAGLEEVTSGELFIDGVRVNEIEPQDRGISMVFQNYALYPHMTVEENMGFSLKMKKEKKDVIKEKVRVAAEILGLIPYLDRKPKALSGGQRQRVALGRAIVREAKVFLMDEPLSNLDAKLRSSMRAEILRIHRNLNATTVYVSHDQIEAMTMATKIVIMNAGKIMQVGTPDEVYNNPQNKFVAGFIGTPTINFLEGTINQNRFTAKNGVVIEFPQTLNYSGEVVLGIRPNIFKVDNLSLSTYKTRIKGQIIHVELVSHIVNVHFKVGDEIYVIETEKYQNYQIDQEVEVTLNETGTFIFDQKTEERIF